MNLQVNSEPLNLIFSISKRKYMYIGKIQKITSLWFTVHYAFVMHPHCICIACALRPHKNHRKRCYFKSICILLEKKKTSKKPKFFYTGYF